MGSNPNTNILCRRMIRATRFDEQANAQRSVDLEVVDRCKRDPTWEGMEADMILQVQDVPLQISM